MTSEKIEKNESASDLLKIDNPQIDPTTETVTTKPIPNLPLNMVHEILLYCDPKTLRTFECVSHSANDLIRRYRMNYQRLPVFSFSYWRSRGKRKIAACKDFNHLTTLKVIENEESLCDYAYNVQPDWFIFADDDDVLKIDLSWWKKVKKVELTFEEARIDLYYRIFQVVPNLHIEYKFEADGNQLFENVKCICIFVFHRFGGTGLICNDRTMELIAEKSFNGTGLLNIHIDCHEQKSRVTPAGLIKLITASKMNREHCCNRACIHISDVYGGRSELYRLLRNTAYINEFCDGDGYFLIRIGVHYEVILTVNNFSR